MTYVRISPGVYRDSTTGKTINSATDPNKTAPAATPTRAQTATTAQQARQILPVNTPLKTVPQQVNAAATVADAGQIQSEKGLNGNINGPDASTTAVVGPDGQVTQTTNRSPGQAGVAAGQDATSTAGYNAALNQLANGAGGTFNPTLTQRTTSGDLLADRKKVEDSVYSSLTKNTDEQEAQNQEKIAQNLQNRGITYSDDPDSQYQKMMKDSNNRFDTIRSDARNQAVITGGNEFRSDAGLNETQRANDQANQQSSYNTNLNATNTLAGIGGAGLRSVNTPGVQGAAVNYDDPAALQNALTTLSQNQQTVNIAKQKAASSGRSSNNGSSTTVSAFV